MAVGCLFSVVVGALALAAHGWLKEDPHRPISKLITMLQDMQNTLQSDQKADEDIYDKMACWCHTNGEEKTKAIAEAEERIADLTSDIEELTATSARLATELEDLDKEVADNKESLAQATAIRKQQQDAFNGQDKELIETVSALKAAIEVLSKHQSSLLQQPLPGMRNAAKTLQEQLQHHVGIFKGVLSESQRKELNAFVQTQLGQEPGYLGESTDSHAAYVTQSDEIFGILTEMLEQFESDMSISQTEELEAQENFKDMKTAKQTEISKGEEQIDKKSEAKADADKDKSQAKKDLEDTQATLSADQQYMAMLTGTCTTTDAEWEERQKIRQEEITAVSKAIEILSTDEAHDTFTRTFNPSFLQVGAGRQAGLRAKAASLLSRVADQVNSPKMSFLATMVKLDDFTEVLAAIDKMMAALLQEKDDEIKHRDWCIDEIHSNEMLTSEKESEKDDQLAHISVLEDSIAKITEEIEELKTEIADTQMNLKRASEERLAQSKEFQTTVADQRQTQALLEHARQILSGYYAASFTQEQKQEPAGPPPPQGFDTYKKSESATGVVGMIEEIIADTKELEAASTRTEQDAQKAYEALVTDTNASVKALSKSVTDKTTNKAKTEGDFLQAKSDNEATMKELEQLSSYSAEVHGTCDFALKNFDVRQDARDQEVEALKQAKQILSGASFS